jgi:hypothetical protein
MINIFINSASEINSKGEEIITNQEKRLLLTNKSDNYKA